MSNTPTTNYGLPKPTKGDYGDAWIAEFNSMQDNADTAIHNEITTGVNPGHNHSSLASPSNVANQLVVDSAGNIGIGTASPVQKCDIRGLTQIAGALFISSLAVGADTWFFSHQGAANNNRFGLYYYAPTPSAELITILTDGKVGIGKTTPGSPLAVASLPVYADNAAAKTGGLTDGDIYRTSTGVLMVVYT